MRCVVHPSFVRRKALRCGSLSAMALLGLLFAPWEARLLPPFSLPLLLGWAVLLKATLSPTLSAVQGYQGEQQVLRQLHSLPDEYLALTNRVLAGSKRGDIDILLLGPMGVLVIEVKTYSGHILYPSCYPTPDYVFRGIEIEERLQDGAGFL